MMVVIIIGGGCVVFIHLIADGYGFKSALAESFNFKGFRLILYGGAVVFLLSLMGGPRRRPPH
jgi:hypothetical protein